MGPPSTVFGTSHVTRRQGAGTQAVEEVELLHRLVREIEERVHQLDPALDALEAERAWPKRAEYLGPPAEALTRQCQARPQACSPFIARNKSLTSTKSCNW